MIGRAFLQPVEPPHSGYISMNLNCYLENSEFVDWNDPDVLDIAKYITRGTNSTNESVSACFEFVRDEIKHTGDHKIDQITCKASDVLKYRTGYCYAKSHLLAALLRANKIPAGLTYQRLLLDRQNSLFCLHGLNVVFLETHGWYRLDPRGNKEGVKTEFTPPIEKLAFETLEAGEFIFSETYGEPLKIVTDVLTRCASHREVDRSLPDLKSEALVS